MGYLLSEKDGITSEVFHPESRRESFIIHYDSRDPHPEWLWTDLDELIEVLEALQMFAHNKGIETRKVKPPTVMVEISRGGAEYWASWVNDARGDETIELAKACRAVLEAEDD